MVAAFVSLTGFCMAVLAFGRYQVLRDLLSFWIGLGFASLGIGQFFYVLAWPRLLPDGGAIIAHLTNTPTFIGDLNLTLFSVFLLAAVLIRWPGKQTIFGKRWHELVAAWLFFVVLFFIFLVSFEQYMPTVMTMDGTYTPLHRGLVALLLFLSVAGCILSTRYYLHSRDALASYVAFAQMALVFLLLMSMISEKRYDLWWYLNRVIGVCGYLIVLLGLLSDFVRLLRREREGRLMLDAVMEYVPIGLAVTAGSPDFPLAKVSRHGLEMNQRPAEELVRAPSGQHQAAWKIYLQDGVTQPLPEQMPLYRASRFGEEIRNIEMVMEAQDGRKIPVLINAAPIRDATGQIVAAVNIWLDITQRKEAEAALRENEARTRQILESIPGMVFTTRPDGYCAYQSQQWVEYTGVPMSEHLGDGWNKLLHPEDQPRAFSAWQAAVESQAPYDLEYRVRRHDGAYQWFKVIGRPICDEKGQIVWWFGVAMNIEELKRAEDELRQAYGQLKAIFDHRIGGIGIVIGNARGDILQANDYYLNLLGYSREELLTGRVDWRRMTPPAWLPADERGLQQLRERVSATRMRKSIYAGMDHEYLS